MTPKLWQRSFHRLKKQNKKFFSDRSVQMHCQREGSVCECVGPKCWTSVHFCFLLTVSWVFSSRALPDASCLMQNDPVLLKCHQTVLLSSHSDTLWKRNCKNCTTYPHLCSFNVTDLGQIPYIFFQIHADLQTTLEKSSS